MLLECDLQYSGAVQLKRGRALRAAFAVLQQRELVVFEDERRLREVARLGVTSAQRRPDNGISVTGPIDSRLLLCAGGGGGGVGVVVVGASPVGLLSACCWSCWCLVVLPASLVVVVVVVLALVWCCGGALGGSCCVRRRLLAARQPPESWVLVFGFCLHCWLVVCLGPCLLFGLVATSAALSRGVLTSLAPFAAGLRSIRRRSSSSGCGHCAQQWRCRRCSSVCSA